MTYHFAVGIGIAIGVRMTVEKRKYPRRSLGLDACVTWPHPVPCRISDVSATGARLTTDHMDMLPDEFDLALNADIMRNCRVVWRKKNQVGVKFLPLPNAPRKQPEAAEAE